MTGNLRSNRLWFAGLLGAAVLAGSPIVAQADQGKWWDPQGRGPSRERGAERQVRTNRGDRGANRNWQQSRPRYQQSQPRLQQSRTRYRQSQPRYQQSRPRFQRSYVTIRDGHRGTGYRAQRVWASPYYIQRQHLVVIRPVRYFIGASAVFGGLRINARFHDHDRYLYGCNFCDARFSGYAGYHSHVVLCDARPSGYRLDVSDWNDEWNDEACDVEGCEIHHGAHAGADYDIGHRADVDDDNGIRADVDDDRGHHADVDDDDRYDSRDDEGYDQ